MARDFAPNADISYTLHADQNNLGAFSFGGWYYLDSNTQYKRLANKGAGYPGMDWDIEFDNGFGGVLVFIDRAWTTSDGAWSVARPATGAWTHIIVTYDSSSTSNDPAIYVNGTSSVSELASPSGTHSNAQTAFYLGSDAGAGEFYDGRMAEIATWNRVLTAAEVLILSKKYAPTFIRNGLVMYIPLIGKRTDEADLIKGITGSVDAGVTAIAHPPIIYPYGDPTGVSRPSQKQIKHINNI